MGFNAARNKKQRRRKPYNKRNEKKNDYHSILKHLTNYITHFVREIEFKSHTGILYLLQSKIALE